MKYDLTVASEFEIVHDCYRSFSIDILAMPKNFIFRTFFESEFNAFRVINREDSELIELRSPRLGSTYIEKKELKSALDLNKPIVMFLKNSKIKVVIPKPNFEWLFSTGREDIKWNPVASEYGHFMLEFDDKFDRQFTVSQIAYYKHPRVQDMADVSPF